MSHPRPNTDFARVECMLQIELPPHDARLYLSGVLQILQPRERREALSRDSLGGCLQPAPQNLAEAVATANVLRRGRMSRRTSARMRTPAPTHHTRVTAYGGMYSTYMHMLLIFQVQMCTHTFTHTISNNTRLTPNQT